MAERLEQPPDAMAVHGRAEQDRDDLAGAGLLGEIVEHRLPVRHLVHQQLLEQYVVMIGKLFEHLDALELLAVGEIGRDVALLGRLAGLVIISSFQRDIDEAGHLLAVADRDPAGDQRRGAHRLQRLEQALDRAARLIDPVDEDHVRDAERLELAQRRFGEQGAVGIGIDDDDGEIGGGDAQRRIGGEADRARRVDQRIAVAHIIEVQQVELGRAAARARLRTGIPDTGLVRDRPLPTDCSGRKKKGLG